LSGVSDLPAELPAELPAPTPELHPDLEHLAFLVGRWEGTGARVWPGTDDVTVVNEVSFSHDGRPFLSYSSRTWTLLPDGRRGEPGPAESGWWRRGAGPRDVEVVLARPEGSVEVLVGTVAFTKIELISDLVARTTTAATEVVATTRLYGRVESDLAYVVEQATADVPLRPYLSAKLALVPTR
jgi:hypothetical protein